MAQCEHTRSSGHDGLFVALCAEELSACQVTRLKGCGADFLCHHAGSLRRCLRQDYFVAVGMSLCVGCCSVRLVPVSLGLGLGVCVVVVTVVFVVMAVATPAHKGKGQGKEMNKSWKMHV